MLNRMICTLSFCIFILSSIVGCSPEVGSEAWCKALKEKPKAEWSANDAKDFAKHCVFK